MASDGNGRSDAEPHFESIGYGYGADGGDRTNGGAYPYRAEGNYTIACFCCGRRLRPEFIPSEGPEPDEWAQPSLGTEFVGYPCYGSLFDDDGPLHVVICDACIMRNMRRIMLRKRDKDAYTYEPYRSGYDYADLVKFVNTVDDDSLPPDDDGTTINGPDRREPTRYEDEPPAPEPVRRGPWYRPADDAPTADGVPGDGIGDGRGRAE